MKKFLYVINLLLLSIAVIYIKTYALESKNSNVIHKNIDLNDKIYVQHNSQKEDVYILNSEGESTVVYEIVNVKYTASKQWTKDGLYIDDLTGKIGATAPDDYIPVKEGEIYFVRLYGIGDRYSGITGTEYHITTPIVYFDDSGNCVGSALSGTYSSSKNGVEITIPSNVTKMYISNYNNQDISIQRKLTLNKEEFSKIKKEQDKILEYVDSNYTDIENDPIVYKELDKAYITFVNDDTRPNIDKFADLFIEKNVPLCLATVASNLLNNTSSLNKTRLDVALEIQKSGGEILAHNGPVITNDTINNTDFMYNYFVTQKQLLTRMGFNVNGIILAGGSGQITGSKLTANWTSAIYKYSDLLGEEYNTQLGIDSVYYHHRTALSNYSNDIEKLKLVIDKAIEENSWKVFYFHDTNEISLEVLEELIDYIKTKNSSDIEIVTYNTMYEKFATRETTIKNDKKTYYVSSDGKSKDGTDINNPINLETLNKKKIKTGDTILFKSGDTFFGTLNFTVADVDDNYINISNYGEGDLPTISTYKYISDKWEKYSEKIYRIDIKDINNYTGYNSNSNLDFNVGFLEDDNGIKYYNKKSSIDNLGNLYDFYSDGSRYLYMYIDDNPYKLLGNLKVVVRSNLMNLTSNMKISNIRFAYTGGHALEGALENEENIIIENCIIENIGGSYLYSSSLTNETRYGNGIEFYGSNAKNIEIRNNIFRNIYDVAFTIQGTKGSGTNVYVHNNVFINNSQDSEIWQSDKATGVYNYRFYENLSINQGRGWGYEARLDKYPAASILFWGYEIENTDILFNNNIFYNPRQIYYLAVATDNYFLNHNTIKSDNNIYYMNSDTTIYRNNWNYETRNEFINKYKVDNNSLFNVITEDIVVTEKANTSNNINKIRLLVLDNKDVIKSVEIANEINSFKIKKGETLNDINLKVNYIDGLTEIVKVDNTMISNINYEKLGIQKVTIYYLDYELTFNLEIIEETINDNQNNTEIEKENNDEKTSEIENNSEDFNNSNSQVNTKNETNNNENQKVIEKSQNQTLKEDNKVEDVKKENIITDDTLEKEQIEDDILEDTISDDILEETNKLNLKIIIVITSVIIIVIVSLFKFRKN